MSKKEKKGTITRIAGPVIGATGLTGVKMNEVVRVGKERLIGEVVELSGDHVSVQVYEETAGIKPGEPVEAMGEALSVNLGPGVVGSIYDGIQRPLDIVKNETGDFISRGVDIPALDTEKKWEFRPEAKKGDEVSAGVILGSVDETTIIKHKVMVPPGIAGKLEKISSGKFTVEDEIAVIKDDSGKKHSVKMAQRWPVRKKRPYDKKLAPEEPLISGQRVIDTFFPIAKGGVASIPGPFGSGKCVSGGTPVLLSTGETRTISGIYEKYKDRGRRKKEKNEQYTLLDEPFGVFGYKNGKIKKFSVKAVYRGKTEGFLKITTRSGRELEVTPAHKLLAFSDLKEEKVSAGKLKKGDYLLAPRKLPRPSCKAVKFPWKRIYGEFRVVEERVLDVLHEELKSLKDKYSTLKQLAGQLDMSYDKLMGYWLRRNRPTLEILIRIFKLAGKDIPAVNKLKGEKNSSEVIIKKAFNRDLALFLGLLAGDGQVKGRSIRFYNSDAELKRFYIKLVEKVFGIRPVEKAMKTVDVVIFESPVVKKLLDYMGFPEYGKSLKIGLPKGLLVESPHVLAAYLAGMILSDGHVNISKGEIEIASSSLSHKQGLAYLLGFMGIRASYRNRKRKPGWRVFIRGRNEMKKFLELTDINTAKFKKIKKYIAQKKADYNSSDIVPLSRQFIERVYEEMKRPYQKLKNAGVEIFNYFQGE
ncbi:MAG: LAGLIDADG family homing endonuclease, partial [Elusimicrobiota bacterium]|nr:LAGLIDADG family homing endonuclease [Elusimicrobiota bacterium]